jgi:hypothetical protein
VGQWILASNGHPFRDQDAALIKRDLLLRDLGEAVRLDVVPHPRGGFAVSVVPAGSGPVITSGDTQGLDVTLVEAPRDSVLSPREVALRSLGPQERSRPNVPRVAGAIDARESAAEAHRSSPYPDEFRLSPAVRAFLGLHVQALLGAILLLQPHLVFTVTRLGLPTGATAGAIMLSLIAICGAGLAVIAVSRFIWAYTANTYVIDGAGVEQVQWYFDRGRLRRRAPRVNFSHLRSVDVDQSVLQLVLNVGTVKLAAGATDSYEVVLGHVTSPRALQREFQRRHQREHVSAKA